MTDTIEQSNTDEVIADGEPQEETNPVELQKLPFETLSLTQKAILVGAFNDPARQKLTKHVDDVVQRLKNIKAVVCDNLINGLGAFASNPAVSEADQQALLAVATTRWEQEVKPAWASIVAVVEPVLYPPAPTGNDDTVDGGANSDTVLGGDTPT